MLLSRRNPPVVYATLILAALCTTATVTSLVRARSHAAGDPAFRRLDFESQKEAPLPYPFARRGSDTGDYHGTKVADPYRWLEQPDSHETLSWIEAEKDLTSRYMAGIPERAAINERLTKLWSYTRYGVPFTQGDVYFSFGNDGRHNHEVLYVAYSQGSEPHIMIDPDQLSPDGKRELTGAVPAHSGKFVAYGLSTSGTDWQEWRIRETRSWKDLPDDLKGVASSSVAWTKDDKSLIYSAYVAADEPKPGAKYVQNLYYHRIGTPQSQDELIYEPPDDKNWRLEPHLAEDGRYLVIYVRTGDETNNRVYFKDLNLHDSDVVPLIDNNGSTYQFISNDGPLLWFLTNQDAPRGRVIAVDTNDALPLHWKTAVPQKDDTLEAVTAINDSFIACYIHEGHSRVERFDLDGQSMGEIVLPGIGIASGFSGSRKAQETFYLFTSFTTPPTLYHLDATDGKSSVFRQPHIDVDPAEYETRQVFYPGKDGTKIPMFVSYKKGLKLDGGNPALLLGDGAFGLSLRPNFSVMALAWMEMGGVYAVANVRGGGEYGEDWHKA
ncbi:MAG TPA: prolyl oligopeptidase family serine peptidase, partial [Blastocatellia bacterium]|nr:prolyl oligopeptidase family serine peptidase [Blastocatellia bacterium]